jgi:hypothetical protein
MLFLEGGYAHNLDEISGKIVLLDSLKPISIVFLNYFHLLSMRNTLR